MNLCRYYNPVMPSYHYSPLSLEHDCIRLLRLMPHRDVKADIQCELFEYSFQNSCDTHLYEALSYVWGDVKERLPVFIHGLRFDVTVNLRAALSGLRNHSIERILWIDAICIDQENAAEKEHQIQYMAKIYGQANRVVVWLGEAANESDLAVEAIRNAQSNKAAHISDRKRIEPAVLALLQRPWFRRIWILQEVAAARNILIMCGLKKIDGYVFCLGVDLLTDSYRAHQDLQGLIRSVTYLIREAIFRAEYSMGSSGRSSLDICPLGELIDMYHAHEATKRHDKLYALLGMSSDNLSKANLSPDYNVPWEKLLQRLVKYLISEEISVETLDNQETAVIKSKGCVLGKVTSVESDPVRNDQQRVGVALRDISEHLEGMKEWKSPWILQVSAKPVQIGDFICLLQGASNPMIVRLREDYFIIVMIAVTLPKRIREGEGPNRWPISSLPEAFFSRKFLLVWDWEIASENLQDLEDYGAWMRMNDWGSGHSRLELGSYLAKGTRAWNIALILEDLNEYEKAEGRYQEAVKDCEMAIEGELSNTLGDQYDPTLRLWAAENDYNAVVDLLLTDDGIDPDSNNRQSKLAPLLWAALGGHKAVVKLLLETGKVNVELEDRKFQRTSLSLAAERGHEAVVRLLLKSNANVDILEKTGDTPLRWAVKGGHKVVVQMLLDTCKVDIDSKDQYGRTLLGWAAAEGYETAVRLLLDTGKVDINSRDQVGRTPLWWAAEQGDEAIVKLLLDTGKVDINSTDFHKETALSLAANQGNDGIVKLLLETDKIDVDPKDKRLRKTPLMWAASKGHEAVVKLLLDTAKVNVDSKDKEKRTPLWWAADQGHEAIVKLLLDTGKVNVDSADFYNDTPLSRAANKGHEAIVKLLIDTGKVDLNSLDHYNQTPLWWAAVQGHNAIVKMLLETGKVDVNLANQDKQSPLWRAADEGHAAVVKLLLETGKVDVHAKNYYGKTPLLMAIERGHEAVVKMLQEVTL